MGRKDKRLPPRPGQKSPTDDARTVPPSPQQDKVVVSFEPYESGSTYCLCRLIKEQIKLFLSCLHKLTKQTWQQLQDSGGSRTGLNYTRYARSALRNPDMWPKVLSPDIDRISGVRASERSRLYGARIKDVFHVVWFDEAHEIIPG